MSVGGIGGAGGASVGAGAGSTAGASAAGTAAPEVSSSSDSMGAKEVSESVSQSAPPPMDGCGNKMSTQNFISLQNSAIQNVSECQSADMDMKKLIELMMAIKLLEELNKNQ